MVHPPSNYPDVACSISFLNGMLSFFRRRLSRLLPMPIQSNCKKGANLQTYSRYCCFKKRRTGQSPMPKRLSGIDQKAFQEGDMTKRETMPKTSTKPITAGITDVFFQHALRLVNALNHAAFPTGAVQMPARSFPRTRIGSNSRLFLLRGTSPDQPAQSGHQDRWHRRDTTQCPR